MGINRRLKRAAIFWGPQAGLCLSSFEELVGVFRTVGGSALGAVMTLRPTWVMH